MEEKEAAKLRKAANEYKEQKELYGQPCGGCVQNYPNRNPSVLFPGQKCGWCGWVDPRERISGVHK
jgi:hypothetical protein